MLRDAAIFIFVFGPILYVAFAWKRCICRYSFVCHCPRHGEVRDEEGNSLVEWLR